MSDSSKTVRPPVKRMLKPAPAPRTHVQPPALRSEVRFVLPGSIRIPDSVQIRTIATPLPFLEPEALKRL